MQRGSVKKKLPVLLPFPPILFLNVGKKTLPFIIKRSDDNMPWPTQFKIMLELKRNQIIFQAIFLGMWPRKNTTPTTIANGLPKRLQRKKWYDMIWYDMIWYDMIWYDMIYISEWAWGNSNATQQTRLSKMISWPMDEQAFENNGRGFFFQFYGVRASMATRWLHIIIEKRVCWVALLFPHIHSEIKIADFFSMSFSFFRFLKSLLFLLQEVTAALTSTGT